MNFNNIFILIILIFINSQFKFSENLLKINECKPDILDYKEYGEFHNENSQNFYYNLNKTKKFKEIIGDGIFPYNKSEEFLKNSELLKKEGKLSGSYWDFLNKEVHIAYYKWMNTDEIEPGIKQFFIADFLKRAGFIKQAIYAYYSVIINFPSSYCWSKDKTYIWYPSEASLDEIKNLCRIYNNIGITLENAYIEIKNRDDDDIYNDEIYVNPGYFTKLEKNVSLNYEIKGSGKVQLKKYDDCTWQLLVNGKPFFIKGVSYAPTKVGETPQSRYYHSWMWEDLNNNGKIDALHDIWLDMNHNNKQDENEKPIGDFYIMKEMGINAIRIYNCGSHKGYKKNEFNKELLNEIYDKYGIMFIMGDFFGAYTVGSEADYNIGTDYTDKSQREKMKDSVKRMVEEHKDEPYVLMWLIGNENDLPLTYNGVNATRTNASIKIKEYLDFVNETAKMIKEIDKNHPIALSSVTTNYLEKINEYAPSIDIFAINSYRKNGFGAMFETIKRKLNKPVLIAEFGSDAYYEGKGEKNDLQSEMILTCWNDIKYNAYDNNGSGNSIGGCFFEWVDEWWKDTHSGDSDSSQQTKNQGEFFTFDGYTHEEWFGLFSQGDGSNSPFLRAPRKIYYEMMKEKINNLK